MKFAYLPLIWLMTTLLLQPKCWVDGVGSGVKSPSISSGSKFSIFAMTDLLSPDDELEMSQDTEECRVKNLKQQQRMSMAKLDAHRCLIRDVVVPIPSPATLITTFIQPSHVVVPRCTGLCLERPGCECVPKKTRHHKVNVVFGVNSTQQICSTIDIEEHRGPCKCKCLTKNCHFNKVFDRDACLCRCKDEFGPIKRDCALEAAGSGTNMNGRHTPVKFWDEDTCSCKCVQRICVDGYYQDRQTCECKPIETTCSAVGVRDGSSDLATLTEQKVAQTPKYIGLSCVILVALAMILTLYYLVAKKRDNRTTVSGLSGIEGIDSGFRADLQSGLSGLASMGSHGSLCGTLRSSIQPHGTAYTITINSQSASGQLDDAVVPLTEDKTRF